MFMVFEVNGSGVIGLKHRTGLPGTQVVTCLLHDSGHAELIHLRHGEHLHTQLLQDEADGGKRKISTSEK